MEVDFSNWYFVNGHSPRLLRDLADASWSDRLVAEVVYGARYARKACRAAMVFTSKAQVLSVNPMPLFVAKLLEFEGFEPVADARLSWGLLKPVELPGRLSLTATRPCGSHGDLLDASRILHVTVAGHYPCGSAGVVEAAFLKEGLSLLAAVHQPAGLIVDLRQLDYVWGDELDVTVPDRLLHWKRQTAVITEEQARTGAFAWALGPDGSTTDFALAIEKLRVA